MKTKNVSASFWMTVLLTTLMVGTGFGQVNVVTDTYNVTGTGSGFGLGAGVNTLINPPSTRLTGTMSANLRYIQTVTNKAASVYTINNNSRIRVNPDSAIGRFTISGDGTTPFDFGAAVGAAYATPTNRATYDVSISMRNDAPGTARFSFAIATQEGDTSVWDFGLQMYRAATADTFYTLQKRIDSNSSGLAADQNLVMATTTPNTVSNLINFLIRVTDAGAETTGFNSRIQVSTNNGTSWIYDTDTDSSLTSGTTNHWRFDGPGRYIMFDQAGNSGANGGPVYYDSFSIISTYAPAAPTIRTWSGLGGDDNWSTGANWQGTAPVNGNALVFGDVNRQANFNDIADLTVASVTLSNAGFTLGGLPFSINTGVTNLTGTNTFAGDVAWGYAGATNAIDRNWNVASGSEIVLNNTNLVEILGDQTLSGGGTLRLKGVMGIGVTTSANPAFDVTEGTHIVDGGIFNSRGGYRLGTSGTGSAAKTILTNNANMTLTSVGGNFRVGVNTNPITTQLIIDNSALSMSGGILSIPYSGGATSIVSQVGGVVSGAAVSFSTAGPGKGTYNIKNGTLETYQIRKDTNTGNATISFDNATLRTAVGASNAFLTGLNSATIQAGGLVLDATSDITIAQVLKGTGALIKSNSATTVTMTGANTYSGNTVIQGGKLVVSTAQAGAGTVQVGDGAELGVTMKTAGGTLNVGGLQFNGLSFGAVTFDLATFSTPTNAIMRATNLTVSGPVTVSVINGIQLTIGQVVLIDYDSMTGDFANFTLGTLPSGVTAELVNNTANGSIDLNITGVPAFRWTGAVDNNWDKATANWLDLQTSTASVYVDARPVEFRDDATRGDVNLSFDFLTPASIIVSNNTLPYVWSGGPLTTSLIKKYGTNSLTRVESGADLITTFELNEGSFVISNAAAAPFATVLTDTTPGLGTLVKKGPGTLTISSTNSTYDGAFVISEGKVVLGPDRSLGSTNSYTKIENGATLDLRDAQPGFEPIIVSGAGVGGAGAIIDSTSGSGVDANLRNVTMVGDTTFGSPSNTRWDLRVRSGTGPGPGLQGNGYNLTKVGAGTVSIACQRSLGASTPYWNMNLGDVVINAGSLAFAESLTLGNPSKTITINSGAGMQLYDLGFTNPVLRNIFINNATLNSGGADDHTNVINGTINLTGADTFRPDQNAFIVNGPVVGSGSLFIYANTPGRVYLNGVNTYAGDTTVTNETLLGGSGSIAGNLIMLSGSTNSPGMSSIATFTVNGNATLNGTTVMELNRSLAQNSDRLAVGGNLTFDGVLRVVLPAGAPAPQAGDVYQLFNKAGSGTFTSINLPTLSAGLSWDTTKLSVDGSIKVNGAASSPNISSTSISGGNFIMSGTGGVQGNNYIVLTSTNVALPVSSWTPVVTNVFGPGGTFGFTNAVSADPATFYLLQVP